MVKLKQGKEKDKDIVVIDDTEINELMEELNAVDDKLIRFLRKNRKEMSGD